VDQGQQDNGQLKPNGPLQGNGHAPVGSAYGPMEQQAIAVFALEPVLLWMVRSVTATLNGLRAIHKQQVVDMSINVHG
jgi:hypothetical protein